MRLFTRIREYLRRRNDLSSGRDPVWDPAPEQAPTQTMPAADYDPAIRAKAAAIVAQAQAEADARAAQASAGTDPWGEWDHPGATLPTALAIEIPPPPPMPPSEISRAMVSQLPAPPVNDRNIGWRHDYADYLRRVGVATGTSTDLEHTMAWGIPALKPGDGTGVPLTGQEHGETGPEVAA